MRVVDGPPERGLAELGRYVEERRTGVGHPGPDPGRIEPTPRRTLDEVLLR
ncbi:hypothetical protein [Pseudonocardia broussonetiae]|uniref:Uncharacterized protein n=1 Tax=Pseudonocardia broussonetiae TaxID=2736640 RepID=A0A6M6JNQ3_9PSEU|nr:hypothetical protein [Pseudonocardia broussonetiae]QJY48995.1 hypothetical protein HOP40_27100 [Pseudonocardia broussonetiae]